MNQKLYDLYQTPQKLSVNSTRWWWINDRKSDREAHQVFIVLKEYEFSDLVGNLKTLLRQRLQDHREYRWQGYDEIFIEAVSTHHCGDTETRYFLVGQRAETEPELATRLKLMDQAVATAAAQAAEVAAHKTAAEYQAYLKLKAKYE